MKISLTQPEAAGIRCCTTTPRLGIDTAEQLAADMQLLAHPVRIVLLDMLAQSEGQVCVCDLEAAVPVKQPTVSHHLRLLREAGLIEAERKGQWMYYHLRHERLSAMRQQIASLLNSLGA